MNISSHFTRSRVRACIAAVPIIGVNATAFIGQFSYMREHITSWPLAGIILLSATLESIAVYLAFEAHEAMRKGDSSGALRMGSYLFGAFIGVLNYSHYAGPDFHPTFLAVATGLMSTSSAPLWGIYSRRIGRERLIELGLIEPRSVKFSRARWLLWSRETFGAFRLAVWTGTQDPNTAIRDYERAEANKRAVAEIEVDAETESERITRETTDALHAASKAERIRIAFRSVPSGKPRDVAAWLGEWGYPDVSENYIRQIRSLDAAKTAQEYRSNVHALPNAGSAG